MLEFNFDAGPALAQEFLTDWSQQLHPLRQAAVLQPLWRWWLRHRISGAEGGASDDQLQEACFAWAEQRWADQLEREFLDRQDRYHRIRFSQLRLESKDLAQELAFQLREGEADFPELNFRYGQAPERKRGGLMPELPLASLSAPVAKILQRLKPGEVAGPIRLPPYFLLMRLDAFTPAVFDEQLCRLLLRDLLEEWLQLQDTYLQHELARLDGSPEVAQISVSA